MKDYKTFIFDVVSSNTWIMDAQRVLQPSICMGLKISNMVQGQGPLTKKTKKMYLNEEEREGASAVLFRLISRLKTKTWQSKYIIMERIKLIWEKGLY